MKDFIKKKIEVEDPQASMSFRPGQYKREPFSLERSNIYLIGMRGSGKTTVGRALAGALSSDFVDTDALVVQSAGRDIDALVAQYGWEHLRVLETQALRQATLLPGKVVATGGGIVLAGINRDLMSASGVCFYLAADAGLLVGRLLKDPNTAQRPALTPLDLHDEVVAVMSEREPLYMVGMDHLLQANRSVEQLIDDIMVALGLKEWDYSEKERIIDRY